MTVEAPVRADNFFELTADAVEPDAVVADVGPGGVAVTIRDLWKSFGQKQILRGIDLHIPAGEFVAIVGRSGCGKSTLLVYCSDSSSQAKANSILADTSNRTLTAAQSELCSRSRGFCPGHRSSPTWRSDWAGNVPRRMRASGRPTRCARLNSRNGALTGRRYLSGGQKQRVALARALVSQPRLLAFDEPLGALDALTRLSMRRLIERVWFEQKFTAIMVTHDVAEAVTLADRVLLIEDGRIALIIASICRARAKSGRRKSRRWKGEFCTNCCGTQARTMTCLQRRCPRARATFDRNVSLHCGMHSRSRALHGSAIPPIDHSCSVG